MNHVLNVVLICLVLRDYYGDISVFCHELFDECVFVCVCVCMCDREAG